MIDIHCHILPNIDDGASTMETSLEMARLAVTEGITDLIVTPHGRHPQFDNAQIDVPHLMDKYKSSSTNRASVDVTSRSRDSFVR